MSRRHKASKREILPDPQYKSETVSKFINCMMYDGKRAVSQQIFYDALDVIAKRTKQDSLQLFMDAIATVKPFIEVRSRRVGGATYQVPVEVPAGRQLRLAIKWIIDAARKRKEKEMKDRLAAEIIEAAKKSGGAYKKSEETYKMAEANRAFAHYRW